MEWSLNAIIRKKIMKFFTNIGDFANEANLLLQRS